MTADTAPQEGVKNTDPFAQDYTLNHTMLRIKDPKPSLAFYCTLLGMSLIRKIDVAPGKFTLYFLGYLDPETEIPTDPQEQVAFVFQQRGLLELTHNWGTEDDPEQSYHDGNADPRGFGHIGISVPDVAACCDRLEAAGCSFVKRPDEGMMKGLAFVRDPDMAIGSKSSPPGVCLGRPKLASGTLGHQRAGTAVSTDVDARRKPRKAKSV